MNQPSPEAGTRRYDLLIFDWDGTLADSAAAIVSGMQAAIAQLGLPKRSDAQIARLIGLGVVEGLQILYPDRSPAEVRQQLAEFRTANPPTEAVSVGFFDGVPEVLDALKAQQYVLTVATGKSRPALDAALSAADYAGFFTATRTVGECPSKPAPDMVEELLWETDTPPERALMIGDTEFDLAMARNAGVDAVGVRCGVHSEAELARCQPVAILDTVAELPTWLDVQD